MSVVLLTTFLTLVLVYQNCASDSEGGSTSKSYNIPFPLDAHLNQFSTMSCWHPSYNSSTIYGFKFGSFDNSRFSNIWNITDEASIKEKLIGGIGLNKDFLNNYSPKTTTEKFQDYLLNSNWKETQPLVVTLSKNYSIEKQLELDNQQTDPTRRYTFPPAVLMRPLSNLEFVKVLTYDLTHLFDFGTLKFSYSPLTKDSMIGEFNVQNSESRKDELFNNYDIALAYSAHSFESGTFPELALPSPSSDPKRGYGRKYSIDYNDGAIIGVSERNLSDDQLVQSNWECFSLTIVRDLDRRDSSGSILNYDPISQYPGSTDPKITGKKICQVQNIGNISATDRMKLDIARRFLPANYWEINIEQACAVPPRSNNSDCFGTGSDAIKDNTDYQDFVRYTTNCSYDTTPICAPKISFCFRKG